jgi:predicted Zn-dependent protease with MMP-like domain
VRVSRDRFEEAVRIAVDSVPPAFQTYLQDIEFVVAEASPDGLLGLYEGAGALGQSGWPARITIFQRAHEERCRTWRELRDEVRRTVLHEIGHHFQMEEQELPW